jgi:hypothetical protein
LPEATSWKVTVPVAVAGLTTAINVNGVPEITEPADEVKEVVVGAGLTISCNVPEIDP